MSRGSVRSGLRAALLAAATAANAAAPSEDAAPAPGAGPGEGLPAAGARPPGEEYAEPALARDTALRLLGWQMSDLVRVRADFRLLVRRGAGDRPVETGTGRLYVDHRGLLRMRYDAPADRTVFVGYAATEVYRPERALVEVFPFRRHPERWERLVHVAFTEPDGDLGRALRVEGFGQTTTERHHLFSLALRPEATVATEVERLRVDYDTASFLPLHLHFELRDGDVVDLRLRRRVLDPELDAAWFRAEWPEGTRRVLR